MSRLAKLTIISPTLNCAATIEACAYSILRQKRRDFEVIFADGGSTDGTVAILEEICQGVPNARVYSEPDAGIYDAMNKGMARGAGEWLLFLGGDDALYDPDVLGQIMPRLTEEWDIVYGDVLYRDGSGGASVYDGPFTPRKLARRNICHQAMFIRATLFERFGPYDLKYPIFADWAFNLRVFPQTRNRYAPVIVAACGMNGRSTFAPDPHFHHDRLAMIFCNTPSVFHRVYAENLRRLTRMLGVFWKAREFRKALRVMLLVLANVPVRVLLAMRAWALPK